MPETAPRPAVVRGQPRAFKNAVWLLLTINLPMVVFAIFIVAQAVVIPAGSSLQSLSATIVSSVVMLTATLLLGGFITIRGRRMSRAIATDPMPCLACLYPLTREQALCPECGSFQNTDELAPRWKDWIRKHRR